MNVVVLTGAGISAESDLGTFRDSDGVWARWEWKKPGLPMVSWESGPFCTEAASVEWMVKLEAKDGWGKAQTFDAGRVLRHVQGLAAGEAGLMLEEAKTVLAEL